MYLFFIYFSWLLSYWQFRKFFAKEKFQNIFETHAAICRQKIAAYLSKFNSTETVSKNLNILYLEAKLLDRRKNEPTLPIL